MGSYTLTFVKNTQVTFNTTQLISKKTKNFSLLWLQSQMPTLKSLWLQYQMLNVSVKRKNLLKNQEKLAKVKRSLRKAKRRLRKEERRPKKLKNQEKPRNLRK